MPQQGAKMDIDNEIEAPKISRVPGNYKFRALGEKKSRTRRVLVRMADVTVDKIDWLWEPYIPLGRLTILGGDPGAGKSFITTGIASALSNGERLPGEVEYLRKPMVTLMLNAEDDPADTIKPRLDNLCANQEMIFVSGLDIVLNEEGLETIAEMVDDVCAKLVIIDPIVAFLGEKVDMNKANEIRHIMKGLARIARSKNIAIVIVRHNRKAPAGQSAGNALYSGMGSIDFTASVRSELAVTETRQGAKFLNHIKANSGKKGLSIQYEIVSLEDGSGKLNWLKLISPGIAAGKNEGVINTSFKDEAVVKVWLHDLLSQAGEPVSSDDVFAKGQLKGYSITKINRSKKGVAVSYRDNGRWYWKVNTGAKSSLEPDVLDMVE